LTWCASSLDWMTDKNIFQVFKLILKLRIFKNTIFEIAIAHFFWKPYLSIFFSETRYFVLIFLHELHILLLLDVIYRRLLLDIACLLDSTILRLGSSQNVQTCLLYLTTAFVAIVRWLHLWVSLLICYWWWWTRRNTCWWGPKSSTFTFLLLEEMYLLINKSLWHWLNWYSAV
jgi:hypothetical protein